MQIKMNHETVDTINSLAWGAGSSILYAFVEFETADFIFNGIMVISKASLVGFFGGLFGYLAKALGEYLIAKIKGNEKDN